MPEGNSQGTIKFYRTKLKLLLAFCPEKEIETVQQIDPGAIRLFLAWMEEVGHNPVGVHAAYRTLRTFLYWWARETEPVWWKNPLMSTVKKYETSASQLADWMETNLLEGLTVFSFPKSHQRRLRTANLLERLNKEVKRRTRMVGIFPNEAACLRLVSAVLMEKSEAWLIGHKYLSL